ncbi:hypothetical protein QBC41DRAFT_318223 [Cercophora samala]|uniref:Uncharacterized protein n=1 Tax=Cercophora samala TaxID=330535 RepID=A0AA39ZFW0_9PEZI|nr:hypothetical protein QBC41DRAFT_318223 [Cercophora samala]
MTTNAQRFLDRWGIILALVLGLVESLCGNILRYPRSSVGCLQACITTLNVGSVLAAEWLQCLEQSSMDQPSKEIPSEAMVSERIRPK